MSTCGTKRVKFPGSWPAEWKDVNTEDGRLGKFTYVPDMPVNIDPQKKIVDFWVGPVYSALWYTPCDLTNAAAACTLAHDPEFPATKSLYYTGLTGLDAAEQNGLKCYGSTCGVFNAKALCASRLAAPRISQFGGGVIDKVVYNDDKSVKAVHVVFGLGDKVVTTESEARYVFDHIYDGANPSKYIPRNVGVYWLEQYCKSNPEKLGCDFLKYTAPDVYKDVVNTYCKDDKLHTRVCRQHCGDTNVNCDERIESYCKSLGAKALDKDHSDVCGCFMGNQFYKGYFDELKKKFNFPGTAPPSHVCYFDYCASSNLKPYNYKQNPAKCPDVMNCFQNTEVVITAGGNIEMGDVTVKPTLQCQQLVQRKCVADSDCKLDAGAKCVQGVCKRDGQMPPPQPSVECTSDRQCPQNARCVGGKCATGCSVFCYGKCVAGRCVYEPNTDTGLVVLAALAAAGTAILAVYRG